MTPHFYVILILVLVIIFLLPVLFHVAHEAPESSLPITKDAKKKPTLSDLPSLNHELGCAPLAWRIGRNFYD